VEIIISGRHFEVSPELREYTEERIRRIDVDNLKLTTARVVMELEKSRQTVEIHLQGKHLHLDSTATTHDMYQAVDEAAEKMEKQVRRHLDRVQDHHHERPVEALEEVLTPDEELEIELELEEEELARVTEE